MAPRVARCLSTDEQAIDAILFAIEGSTYGIVGTFLPQVQKRRVLVIASAQAHLIRLTLSSRPRDSIWHGSLDDVQVAERRPRSSVVEVGGRRLFLPSPANRRLDATLIHRDDSTM